ncbi:class I SAM-dependent methyltransferase [Acidithrix ferrooxidans]|nr:class I SAM-dependent methyltransferase [Acidithrix ferrooxidans]
MTNQPKASSVPRWFTDHQEGHSEWYIERFRKMAADGADLDGEARLIDALVAPHARILDAGCGPGRVGAALFRRGHQVLGVDVDPLLIDAARQDHPGPTWLVADLAELDLAAMEHPETFDGAVLAGNVMLFLAPGTGAQVLGRIARHLRSDAPIAVGFALDRGYSIYDFDMDLALAGLTVEHRFATWDIRPWTTSSDYAVSVLRTSAGG